MLLLKKQFTFLVDEDVTDFTIKEASNTFYLAINNGIYSSNPDPSQTQPQVTTLFYDLKKPIKAVFAKKLYANIYVT